MKKNIVRIGKRKSNGSGRMIALAVAGFVVVAVSLAACSSAAHRTSEATAPTGSARAISTSPRVVVARPRIEQIETAPTDARPLIKTIAKRSDATCYPAIIGKQMTTHVVVDKYNFQSYDFVSVVNVFGDGKLVALNITCGSSSSSDFITLTADGWKELGSRQI